MDESDLERYGVTHALHRRKIAGAVARFRNVDVEENLDIDELEEFLAVVDENRVRLIARLKVAFDKFDKDEDGLQHSFEVRECLVHLGRTKEEMEETVKAKEWLVGIPGPGKNDKSTEGGVNFADFVCAYCDVFAGIDPEVRGGDAMGGEQTREINERIKVLKKTGHVSLVPQTREGLEELERKRRKGEEEEGVEVRHTQPSACICLSALRANGCLPLFTLL